MNLFKSVLSEFDHNQHETSEFDHNQHDTSESHVADLTTSSSSSWSFDSLIKTLATKSESVIGSYRRDFEEFGSELKKETSIIRRIASRAVNDFPDSFEIGASVAQESLESVGQAIDDIGTTVWKSTAKIISHGKESLFSEESESESESDRRSQGLSVKPYSRFEMQLLAIQSDKATYVRESDDLEDFENWRLGFKLEEKSREIVDLINENKSVKVIYEEIVPVEVDAETFWRRYFYKVHKLEQAEEARVKLVKRAISGEDEEELSWDLDDEGDETGGESSLKNEVSKGNCGIGGGEGGEKGLEIVVLEEEKVESREVSSKDSDISVISTQPSLPEVEDLGWDQMEEDIRSNEDRSFEESEQITEKKSDWRKRVSIAEEEADLTWDIEDEVDDSVKQ